MQYRNNKTFRAQQEFRNPLIQMNPPFLFNNHHLSSKVQITKATNSLFYPRIKISYYLEDSNKDFLVQLIMQRIEKIKYFHQLK